MKATPVVVNDGASDDEILEAFEAVRRGRDVTGDLAETVCLRAMGLQPNPFDPDYVARWQYVHEALTRIGKARS